MSDVAQEPQRQHVHSVLSLPSVQLLAQLDLSQPASAADTSAAVAPVAATKS
jgi:hypothetical protein